MDASATHRLEARLAAETDPAAREGYRVFLMDEPIENRRYERAGLDLVPATDRLLEFYTVESTYLAMFLVLGAIGLAPSVGYQVNDKLTLRAGYSDADEPWKDVNTLFNVLAPATVEKHASLGATYKLDRQSGVNLAFTHAFENTIEGTSQYTGPQTGHVRMSQNILQISYSRNIGIQ